MNEKEAYPQPWIRAHMPTAILACLAEVPLHGYAIAQALSRRGFGTPKGGSLYPALAKLEEAGCISATWAEGPSGPGRKEYTLTQRGRDVLAEERALLASLIRDLSSEGE